MVDLICAVLLYLLFVIILIGFLKAACRQEPKPERRIVCGSKVTETSDEGP